METQHSSTEQDVAAGIEATEKLRADGKAGKWKTVLKEICVSERPKEVR
jgi:hypothetical protein